MGRKNKGRKHDNDKRTKVQCVLNNILTIINNKVIWANGSKEDNHINGDHINHIIYRYNTLISTH
jgi:hypothetical protein